MMTAVPKGSNDTNEKNSHSTMYWAALGLVSEMSLRASGMNPPGLASVAPAPTMAMTGELAILLICSTMLLMRLELGGRRRAPTTHAARTMAATTSTIATHVLGCAGVCEAALLPS